MTARRIGPRKVRVYSHKTGRNLGTYPSMKKAKAAIRRHKYFARHK